MHPEGERSIPRGQRWLLWYVFLGPPLAWALHIGARYPLVPTVCKQGISWPLHLLTALCLGITWGAMLASIPFLRRTGGLPSSGQGLPATRIRHMALGGLGLGVLFGSVILAELLPALLQDPCLHVRTGAETE